MRLCCVLLLLFILISPVHAVPPSDGIADWLSPLSPTEQLIRAIGAGDKKTVLKWLQRGINVNAPDPNNDLPLAYAVGLSSPEIVQMLLDYGADINGREPRNGLTVLHNAILMDRVEIVKLLLERGADVNAEAKNGWRPLHEAAGVTNSEMTRLLLAKGAKPNVQDQAGRTPLMRAVAMQQTLSVRLLLEVGADPDIKDKYGDTALIQMAYERPGIREWAEEIAALLLAKKANLNIRNRQGYTALMIAMEEQQAYLVTLLEQAGASAEGTREVRLYLAAMTGDSATVEKLLKEGANPNVQGRRGSSALVYAAMNDHLPVVRLLVEKGADVNVRSLFMRAPALFYAVGNLEMARLLIEKGTDLKAVNDWGDNVFFSALSRDAHPDVIRLFLDKGFDANLPYKGMMPLMRAAKSGNMGAITVLLERGADIKASDTDGNTALHHAVMRYPKVKTVRAVLELLLAKGAEVRARNHKGETPLMLAFSKSYALNEEEIALLKAHESLK